MKKVFRTMVLSCCVALVGILAASGAQAGVPAGFKLIESAEGVDLFRKSTARGAQFVQVIDLEKGASVKLLAGPVVDRGRGQGVYGGDNPTFARQTLSAAWRGLQQTAAAPPR